MGTGNQSVQDTSAGYQSGYGSPVYRSYVLNTLLIVYLLNFLDRGLLSVVARPLKADIQMSDFQFGLLTGIAFAVLYSVLGIPIALLSERKNRVWIIGICLAIWSIMTAACGLATDITIGGGLVIGGYWLLLICRVGVGIGEAGCTPPANSLIADYYPPRKRSTALGYYGMGVGLGVMMANLIGGPITQVFTWREAFFFLGMPGVVVAAILVLTVREPPRGFTDPPGTVRPDRASFALTLKELTSKPSYWWMAAGATLAAFCGYAVANFQSLYLQRTFDLNVLETSVYFNAPSYAAGAIGTVAAGWLAERLGAKSVSAIAWLAAIGLLLCVPFYIVAFKTDLMWLALAGLSLGHFVKYGYLTAQYTIGQGVASMRSRATATAILLLIINLIGYGMGPPFAGLISDMFFRAKAGDAGYGFMSTSTCDAAQEALSRLGDAGMRADILGGLRVPLTEAQFEFCQTANAGATEAAMLTISAMYVLAAVCFLMCLRTLENDLVAK